MKHFLLICLFLTTVLLVAVPVSRADVLTVAQNWTQQWAPQDFTDRVIKSVEPISQANEVLIYKVNYTNGFVLISADDAALPIIGYGYNTSVPERSTNPAFLAYLDDRKAELLQIKSRRLDNLETAPVWREILSADFSRYGTRSVSPLLTTNWNQDWPYNMYCPADAAGPGGHVYSGCVANAMSMVMKYWNWPITGVGSHTYNAYPYGNQSANFGATTYQWTQMPNSAGSTPEAIARLQYHCAVAVDMDFAPDGSGAQSADAADALEQYFRYNTGLQYVLKQSYSQTGWDALLRDQIDNAHPLYYSGYGNGGGHAFNCDGYQADTYFHFNWGWGGSDNGYFYTNALNTNNGSFNQGQGVIINVHPANYNIAMSQVALEAAGGDVGSNIAMKVTSHVILPAWNITHLEFVVEYDNYSVLYNGFDLTGTMLEGQTVTATELMPGQMKFSCNLPAPLFGQGILLKPLFTPIESGTYPFNIANVYFNTTAVTSLISLMVDVTAPVQNPQDTTIDILNAMNVTYNTVATVPVTATYLLPHWNLPSVSFNLHYPPAKLTWEDVEVTDCLLEGVEVTATETTAGVVAISADLPTPFYGSGNLLKLKLRATGNTGSTSVAALSITDFFFGTIAVTNLSPGNVVLTPITAIEEQDADTAVAALHNNFPNPFNPNTTISYSLKNPGKANLTIYNIRGEKVITLMNTFMSAGRHELIWDGIDAAQKPVSSGVYYCVLQTAGHSSTRKMVLMK